MGKSNDNIEDGSLERGEERLQASLEDMSATNPVDFTFHDDAGDRDGSDSERQTASILDLIETKDEFVSLAGSDDVDEILQGDSLDEILKNPAGEDKGKWRTSKTAEELERRRREARAAKRKLRIVVVVAFVVLVAGLTFIYSFVLDESVEALKPIHKVSLEQLNIPPNLKDEGKLTSYNNIAIKLLGSGKIKEAQTIFRKLAATGWNGAVVNKYLGECREKLGDANGALKYFKKAVELGYYDDPHPVVVVAESYYRKREYSRVILALRIPSKLFPKNEAISALLGAAYFQTGNRSKAIKCFDRTNPSRLSKEQMRAYASMLESKGDLKSAFKLYLTLAKAYGDEDAFVKAEKYAPDQKTRVYLLATLISKFKNTPKGAAYTVKLAERKFFNDERDSALRLLEGVDSDLLDADAAESFLGMIKEFRDSPVLLNECHKILNKRFAADCDFQIRLKDSLIRDCGLAFCREFFKQQYGRYSNTPVANYMQALFQSSNERRIELLKRALKLNPYFLQAALALGEIYISGQEWRKARTLFLKCLRIAPGSLRPRFCYSISELKLSGSPSVLNDYERFLKRTGLKKADRLKELIALSQYMDTPDKTISYLKEAERIPELSDFVTVERIKTKFIYNSISESDFPKPLPSSLRFYYQMFLISKGRSKSVMLMPTSRKEFPEFWKVFIGWRNGMGFWRKGAALVLKRDADDLLISTTAKLWLKKISPAAAVLIIDALPYQDKPLLAIMIAERYYRDGSIYNSELFYKRAERYSPPNIYVQLAEFLRRDK